MNYQLWTNKAIEHIDDLQEGTIFELKKLFQGQEWDSISVGERKSFGRYFSNEVKDGRVRQVEPFQPDKKGSTKYIKR